MSGTAGEDFLQKYLEHLERRASQDGINKWLLIAAFAAVIWKLLGVFHQASLVLVLEWTGICLALYFVIEIVQSLFQPKDSEVGGLRLRRKSWEVSAETRDASYFAFRFALLLYIFTQHFVGLEIQYRVALAGVFGMLALGGVLLLANVFRRYEAKVPEDGGDMPYRITFGLMGVAVVYGLYGAFNASDPIGEMIDRDNVESLRALVLVLASLFIISKYIEKLRIDSEIVAVRRLWRRRGVGEIDADAATKELRLIVYGASLGEVISADVAELSNRFAEIAEGSEAAEREMVALGTVTDAVAIEALKNSLGFRLGKIRSLLSQIDSECEALKKKVKDLVGEDGFKHSDCREFVQDLDQRCSEQRARSTEVTGKIEALLKE